MKKRMIPVIILAGVCFFAWAPAQQPSPDESLRAQVELLKKQVQTLEARLAALEKQPGNPSATATPSRSTFAAVVKQFSSEAEANVFRDELEKIGLAKPKVIHAPIGFLVTVGGEFQNEQDALHAVLILKNQFGYPSSFLITLPINGVPVIAAPSKGAIASPPNAGPAIQLPKQENDLLLRLKEKVRDSMERQAHESLPRWHGPVPPIVPKSSYPSQDYHVYPMDVVAH